MQQQNAMTANTPIRQPVSAEITQFAENLAQRAHELAESVNGKLYPVCDMLIIGIYPGLSGAIALLAAWLIA